MISNRTTCSVLAAAALLVAAGCGGGDTPAPKPVATPTSAATPAPPTPAPVQKKQEPTKTAEKPAPEKPAKFADRANRKPDIGNTKPATTDTAAITPVSPTTQPAVSTLRLEPVRLNLGTVSTNKYAIGNVTLTNTGADPVTITQCKTSCGCTSANCPKGEAIEPGSSRDVEIKVNAGSRARTITKEVTFMIEGQAPVKMPVTVDVIAYVTMNPQTLDPSKLPDGRVVIRSTDEQPFRVISMNPAVIEDFGDEEKVEHELFLDWERWKALGQQRRLVFNLDHPESDEVSALVRVPRVANAPQQVNPLERANPQRVDPGAPPSAAQSLKIAVKYGDLEAINKALDGDVAQNQRDELLNMAARYGRMEIATALIESGASPKAIDRQGRTPLHAAVQSKNAAMVGLLLAKGADVNAKDSKQGTALLRAAGPFGTSQIVGELLGAGADVNAADTAGQTPLMWAARWGDIARVNALLSAGADIAVRDGKGQSALDYARDRSGDDSDDIVKAIESASS